VSASAAAIPPQDAKGGETVSLPPDLFESLMVAPSDALLADLLEFSLDSHDMGGSPRGTDHDRNEAA
jgi:hypothetical protein